ncbi:AAA family ATPase [Colwellia sp. MSW7]|uniref:AAA family ATPase n=1 Tax=Colwellia maritima TaxID=2912588 RepID=A0ABS9XA97_9GAMM|nr:AAA family ATPase [Colwellia maritima]MCI2285962.1 AAA family ATPase [Colwellia maritima]
MNAINNIQTTTTINSIDFNELERVDASLLFPSVYSPGESQVIRRKNRHEDCIAGNGNYVPQEMVLRRCLAWWHGRQSQPLGLHGETGTGKTEMLLFIADMLNEPVYIIKTHQGLMPDDLEGSKELTQSPGGIVTTDKLGLAAKGYMCGGLIIFDEVDKGNDALHCSIHGLVEGKPWPIEQFGIVLQKHSLCRVAATANTMGEGGHDRYHTSNRMDAALRSRFGWLNVGYPDAVTELDILTGMFPKLPKPMLKTKINLANRIRDAVLGTDRKGIDDPLGAVFSTRTLVNWCESVMCFGLSCPWSESLAFAFDGSVDPESRDSVDDIIQRVLGDLINKDLRDVLTEYSKK